MGYFTCLLLVVVFLLTASIRPALGAEAAGEPGVARRLLDAGREAARLGRYGVADESLRGALAACRAGADERCAWETLSSLVAVSRVRGDLSEARRFAGEAAASAHRIRDRHAQGESYRLLAEVLVEEGRPEEARSAAERALAVGKELGSGELTAWALNVIGDLGLAVGRPEESCRAFGEALEAAKAAELVLLRIRAGVGLGRCLMEVGEFGKADTALKGAFSEALRIGDKLSVAILMEEMGRLEAHRGEAALGEELFLEAIGKYRSMGARRYAERAAAGLARLRAEASLAEEESRDTSTESNKGSRFDLTTSNPRYLDYFMRARRQIDRVFVVPDEVSEGGLEGSVRVAFTLDRSGRLVKASVETPSGSEVLNEAALTTLRLAEPFASFPEGVSQEKVTIVARFVYERDLAENNLGEKTESLP